MYDNYNERGLGRMTLGLCFGIGTFAELLINNHEPIEFAFLMITLILSLIIYHHGDRDNKEVYRQQLKNNLKDDYNM